MKKIDTKAVRKYLLGQSGKGVVWVVTSKDGYLLGVYSSDWPVEKYDGLDVRIFKSKVDGFILEKEV